MSSNDHSFDVVNFIRCKHCHGPLQAHDVIVVHKAQSDWNQAEEARVTRYTLCHRFCHTLPSRQVAER